ncbi:MAG TPA: glycosyltransferase family A protein [Verrucomicrobiales bacterium]|nr:glycosyltransferase family A protein [Verrucomicrobiales bacterium]
MSVTVSLTTTSRRLATVSRTLETLLRQSARPRRIVLWLSEEPFHLDRGVRRPDIPDSVRFLQRRGLQILWTRNTGPYRKLTPAWKRFGGTVVTADDDTLYPRDWLERLLAMHAETPRCVCCFRARRMRRDKEGKLLSYIRWPAYDSGSQSLDCFPTGKDGVLYPEGSLHPEVCNEREFQDLAPTNDDIWFKAMALRVGTPARAVSGHRAFPVHAGTQVRGLFLTRNLSRNNAYLRAVFGRYGLT